MKLSGRLTGIAWLLGAALLINAQTKSGEWRTYGQNPQGWRYSDLTQIDTRTVARLAPKWIYQTGVGGSETTPLVFDGMMFVAGPSNNSWALDAITGRPVWHVRKTPPGPLDLCCGEVNRGATNYFGQHHFTFFLVTIPGKAQIDIALFLALSESFVYSGSA